MKNLCLTTMLLSAATTLAAQEAHLPKPGPEFDVLKADVGTWDVEIKTWAGPGDPTVSKGTETNRMLGDFWLVVDFQGNMMGMDFTGHGVYGYDVQKKHYIGTWIDSMSANQNGHDWKVPQGKEGIHLRRDGSWHGRQTCQTRLDDDIQRRRYSRHDDAYSNWRRPGEVLRNGLHESQSEQGVKVLKG